MKNNNPGSNPPAEQAIQQVLQAERDAERAIEDCEVEAKQIIHQAQSGAQRINTRADQRITNTEMRHDHKLDKTIKSIEREGAVELRLDAGQQYDQDSLQAVIESLATELCRANSVVED